MNSDTPPAGSTSATASPASSPASSLGAESRASRLDRSAHRLHQPGGGLREALERVSPTPTPPENELVTLPLPDDPPPVPECEALVPPMSRSLWVDPLSMGDNEVDAAPLSSAPVNLPPAGRSRPIQIQGSNSHASPTLWDPKPERLGHPRPPVHVGALDDEVNAISDLILHTGLSRPVANQSESVRHARVGHPANEGSGDLPIGVCRSWAGVVPQSLYNWQATKMTVKDRLGFLFNNEVLADIYFIVGRLDGLQRIPAHRFVLSVGSAVFDAMFNSKLATQDQEITLPDVEPASFLALLRFLYSDEVQIGPETVMTTLYTAKKYAVPALEKHCVDFLKHNLSADNAFTLLTQARLFDEPQLAALCLETIDKCTPDALNAEGFIDIDIETLDSVLGRDSLRVKEARLFAAVLRWSEAECLRQSLPVDSDNQRSVLGPLLGKIRFPLMTVEEFAQGPAQSGILSDRESVSLFLHFTVNPKPKVTFLDVPRCLMTGKEQTVCRFQQIETRWGYSGTSDKIRFIVDRRIFVVGFGLYGSIHGPSEYQSAIEIFHTGSGRLLGSNDVTFLSDGTNSTFRVMFKEPVEILPNTNYTASSTLKGSDSHYGTKGMRKVWCDCPLVGRVTFQFSYSAGNNNGTSVEDGQIPEIIFYT